MCTHPLTLSNPKLPIDWRTEKGFLTVPCGHCPDCLRAKQTSWQVRAVAEWMRVQHLGGNCYMYTLTYSDDNIPILNGHKVFSRRHVQLFLKRLRKNLSNLYGTYELMKYIVVSEYGGTTKRPHYHGLFYFNIPIDALTVRSLIDSSWQYGFVAPCKNGGLIKNAAGIMYTMKYITKDMDFTNDIIDPSRSTSEFRSHMPFHLQSRGFGLYLNDIMSEQDLFCGKVSIPVNNGFRDYPIPLYNLRKSIYTTEKTLNGSLRYVLNERGKNLALRKLHTRIERKKNYFYTLCDLSDSLYCSNPLLAEMGIFTRDDFRREVNYDFLVNPSSSHCLPTYACISRGLALNGFAYSDDAEQCLRSVLYPKEFPFQPEDDLPLYMTERTSMYERQLLLFSMAASSLSYHRYVTSTQSWNTRQRVLCDSDPTHEHYSPRPIMSYDEFFCSPSSVSRLRLYDWRIRENNPELVNTKKMTVYERCFDEK